ncbi:ATP-binding protein [Agrobacterium rhizogenes]|nr:ATP-binding protein [Rhizobium rhizogenes]NTH70043.1 ATP-binding protein [Rhizobium rhizogenes]
MWFINRAYNQRRRAFRHDKAWQRRHAVRERFEHLHKVQIWQGEDFEWAICTRSPTLPPKRLCFVDNMDESVQFFDELRNGTKRTFETKVPIVDRSDTSRLPRIIGYFDFSYPDYISTAAAVVLTAEFERLATIDSNVPPTVNLGQWNENVFRKLFQLGFFEVVGLTPKREDVTIEEGDTRTMFIVSAKNADELARVDNGLQSLGAFLNPVNNIPDNIIIELLTGLGEAMSNVTNHAYAMDFPAPYPHINSLWVAATADRSKNTLTVVIYDQGATIPFTYPRIDRLDQVVRYLARTLRREPRFEFENDGTYIRAAMKYGGSRTDRPHRGKGLPQMVDVIEKTGSGSMTVYSRGGWCKRNSNGRFSSGAVPFSFGGTLIEWTVELNSKMPVSFT